MLDLKHLLIEAKQKVTLQVQRLFHKMGTCLIISLLSSQKGASIPGHTAVGARKVPGNNWRRQGLLVLWRSRSQNHQLPQAGRHSAQEGGGRRQEGLPRGELGRLLRCTRYSRSNTIVLQFIELVFTILVQYNNTTFFGFGREAAYAHSRTNYHNDLPLSLSKVNFKFEHLT